MKVVQINATCGSGSVGKICLEVSKLLTTNGIENYILYSLGYSNYPLAKKYCNELTRKLQSFYEKLTGLYGFGATFTTRNLIKELDKIKPDVVHIHNIHSHDCDVDKLCDYLRMHGIRVFWTFHDCWAFTGYCPYFDMAECSKWKTRCDNCSIYKSYSYFFDRSSKIYDLKKKALRGLDLTIVSPSEWLGKIVSESFLQGCHIKIINNGIDLNIFRPLQSNIRERFGIEDKFLILGVANIWEKRKGLQVFINLSKELDDKFRIILVGTNNDIDKQLPSNIISIHKTDSQSQLAELYSAADLFLIPTLEENFPTVSIESLACGTPVLTYNTGGCSEIIDETCGIVVPKGDYATLKSEILNLYRTTKFLQSSCVNRARCYDRKNCFKKYIELYET